MGSAKGAVEAFGTFFPDIGKRERELFNNYDVCYFRKSFTLIWHS